MKLENKTSPRALAIPLVLGNLLTFFIGFTDHIMTSHLGRDAVSAIFISNQIALLVQYVSVGIESATLTVGRRYFRAKEGGEYTALFIISALFALFVTLLTTFVCIFAPKWVLGLLNKNSEIIDTGAAFLRILSLSFPIFILTRLTLGESKSRAGALPSLISPAVAFSVNLVLNFLFTYGKLGFPEMGVRGAAVATVISRCAELISALIFSVVSARGGGIFKAPSRASFSAAATSLQKLLPPLLLSQSALAATNFITVFLTARESAAFGVANSLYNLSYTVISGISSAFGIIITGIVENNPRNCDTSPDLSQKSPSHNGSHAKRTENQATAESEPRAGSGLAEVAERAERSFLVFGVLLSALILALIIPLTRIYSLGAEARGAAVAIAIANAATFPAVAYSSGALFGIIKSGGDAKFALFLDASLFLLFTLPTSIIAHRLSLPAWGTVLLLRAEFILRTHIVRRKIKRGGWARRITSHSS